MNVGRIISSLLAILIATVLACSQDTTGPVVPPPQLPPPPSPVVAGLKEITIASLPSPYYHFEYDSTGRVEFASFASDFVRYDIIYEAGGRIGEMDNNIIVNHDRLVYVYDDSNRVAVVREVDDTGAEFEELILSYDGLKLSGLERHRRINGRFVVDKTMTLSYYPDGNLRELAVHWHAVAGYQDELRYADLFEQYDTGVNVDGFGLLHGDFFDHLVLLPVELQKGNPRRLTRTGGGQTYVADYTYEYDATNRPLRRNGVITVTSGSTAGRQFQSSAVYSY
jgi:hypothetical protein